MGGAVLESSKSSFIVHTLYCQGNSSLGAVLLTDRDKSGECGDEMPSKGGVFTFHDASGC